MKKILASAVLVAMALVTASAQELKTSYFLDNYVYNYRINPAAQFEEEPFTFFSIGVGNTILSAATNVSVSSFIFPTTSGGYTWGFGESIPREQFLSRLSESNYFSPQVGLNIITFGRQQDDFRFTIELNVKSDSYLDAPLSFFDALKGGLNEGMKTKSGSYSFTDQKFHTYNYTELAAGFSRKIGDDLIVGGAAKILLGLAGATINFNNLKAEKLPNGDWGGDCNADIMIASKMFDVSDAMLKGKSLADFNYDAKFGGFGFSGFGLGLDLGVTWTPIENLEVGFSALDLGFINWNKNQHAVIDYKDRDFADLNHALEFAEVTDENVLNGLNYNIHLSAKYRMPFYDKLSAGMLATFQPHFQEARLGIDVTPLKLISLAVSTGINNYGFNLGAAVNLRFPGVDLFLGADNVFFKFGEGMIPETKGLTNLCGGLAIAF